MNSSIAHSFVEYKETKKLLICRRTIEKIPIYLTLRLRRGFFHSSLGIRSENKCKCELKKQVLRNRVNFFSCLIEFNKNLDPKMSSVKEFYRDKSIFVTGVSGFMGKVLLEKLLYSCSNVKQVFVLMREKRGKTGSERVIEFAKIPLFERLSNEKPEMLDKIMPIYGDICLHDLGMSNDDLTQVINETNIVFHMAASVNFEEPVKIALAQNVRAVKSVIDIAKRMPNLVSMVHLSTAFCNVDQKVMDEVVYDWDMDPIKLLDCADVMSDEILENVRKVLLKSHPNIYTYTKRLAEILVRNEHEHLPICIVRPSIGKW